MWGFAGFFETWLLALFGAWIALEEFSGFQYRARLRLYLDKSTADSVAERICLCGNAAALHMCSYRIVFRAFRCRKRFLRELSSFVRLEIYFRGLAVDYDA